MKTIKTIIAAITLPAMLIPTAITAKSKHDLGRPFGFCTRSSRTDNTSTYNITGGGTFTYPIPETVTSVTTLKSNGGDMKSAISNALKKYNVVVLDGSNGDFIVSSSISFYSNRTLIGINGATLRTQWHVTEEMKAALNEAGVPSMSTASGTGGTLSNGKTVGEEAEYNTRQILIDMTGDSSESYTNSGILSINNCSNIIIRNIRFCGPGSIDVSGKDLISLTGSKNVWVDHCEFYDGMDGNFDITKSSDFVTVSWCTFKYTEYSYMHQNTNLIGSSDSEATGYLNTTFANNNWGVGCRQRMPMARVGKIHMLNNYYTCIGNAAAINPRKNSEFLIEGNYFDEQITNAYGQSGATAYTWTSTNYAPSAYIMPDKGTTVTVPYTYNEMKVTSVPTEVGTYAGATLVTDEDWCEMIGDVNKDGLITMADANVVVNVFLSNDTSGIDTRVADVNRDGQITMADANAIVNLFLAE